MFLTILQLNIFVGVGVGVSVLVGVLVGVSVIVGVGVFVGVSVIVGVGVVVLLGVTVLVFVGVFVGVSVIVGVGVLVGVSVIVGVGVKVGVTVGVFVGVSVIVGVGVLVGVSVIVGVGVLVGVSVIVGVGVVVLVEVFVGVIVLVGVYQEMIDAITDIKSVIDERGNLIQIILRGEQNISRDAYNSIKSKSNIDTKYFFRSYPIEFNPNTKKLWAAGLREECDVLIYTAMKDWIDIGLGFSDIILNGNHSVVIEGENYEIKEKALVSQFADTYLYISLGCFKR